MAFYLFQASYTRDQVAAMASNPQDRTAAARTLVEALGGKLHHFFFSFGDYDIAVIIEGPDNASMAAASLALSALGTVSAVKTTPLLTMEEAVAAMSRAGDLISSSGYKPPSG